MRYHACMRHYLLCQRYNGLPSDSSLQQPAPLQLTALNLKVSNSPLDDFSGRACAKGNRGKDKNFLVGVIQVISSKSCLIAENGSSAAVWRAAVGEGRPFLQISESRLSPSLTMIRHFIFTHIEIGVGAAAQRI